MRLAALPAGERGSQGKQRRGIFRYVSAQTGEQPLTRYQGAFKCRYGYGRAAETVHQGIRVKTLLPFAWTGMYVRSSCVMVWA